SERHSPSGSPVFRLVPPGVTCGIHAAWALWMLGYADRAAARSQEALALARSLDDPFSLSYACHLAAALHHWRREHDVVRALEDEALAHDTEHGFGLLLASGVMHRGWLLAEGGDIAHGLARTQEGLAQYRAIGAAIAVPGFLGLVAEMHDKLGRRADARAAITEAWSVAQKSGRHYWEAELRRLSGVLSDEMDAAESSLLQAIEIARRQRAKWLELRAAVSLGRRWAEQGKVTQAHTLLSGVYASFTEGFDTADLREAKSLLETLRTP